MSHVYHDALPGYHPDQILHDGCPTCEERGRDPLLALAHLDATNFRRAWLRHRTREDVVQKPKKGRDCMKPHVFVRGKNKVDA